jgi:hypothetical protein
VFEFQISLKVHASQPAEKLDPQGLCNKARLNKLQKNSHQELCNKGTALAGPIQAAE